MGRRHVNEETRVSRHHRMIQHRSALCWVEARTLASDRVFPRHSHDQLGVGVIVSGAHRSWSDIGNVEARAGDIIMVNLAKCTTTCPWAVTRVSGECCILIPPS